MLIMKNLVVGFTLSLAGVMLIGAAYKEGYNKGVDDCSKMLKLATSIIDVCQKDEAEAE
jgi:hypothetical protein